MVPEESALELGATTPYTPSNTHFTTNLTCSFKVYPALTVDEFRHWILPKDKGETGNIRPSTAQPPPPS